MENNLVDCSSVEYMMVCEFCSAIPGECSPLSVIQTLTKHSKGPLLSAKESSEVIRKLIRAAEKLNGADFYHIDLKPDNVMLQFTNNRVEPIIIDYGTATRQERSEKDQCLLRNLTLQNTPLILLQISSSSPEQQNFVICTAYLSLSCRSAKSSV